MQAVVLDPLGAAGHLAVHTIPDPRLGAAGHVTCTRGVA